MPSCTSSWISNKRAGGPQRFSGNEQREVEISLICHLPNTRGHGDNPPADSRHVRCQIAHTLPLAVIATPAATGIIARQFLIVPHIALIAREL